MLPGLDNRRSRRAGLRWNSRGVTVHDPAGAWGKDKRPVLLLLAEDQLGEQNSRGAGKQALGGGAVNASGQCPNISSSCSLSLFLQLFSVPFLPVLYSAYAPFVFEAFNHLCLFYAVTAV
jgi:hypothetical protein